MTSFDLEPGEEVVSETRATYYMSRMLAQVGMLAVTDRRLLFRPTGRIDRGLGAGLLRIELASIAKIALEHGRKLTVEADKSYLFVGRSLEEVRGQLADRIPDDGEGSDDQEATLASTKVYLFVNALISQSGVLHLTPSRLVFSPIGVLDRAIGARQHQLPLTDLRIQTEGTIDRKTIIQSEGPVRSRMTILGELPEDFLAALDEARDGAKTGE